MTIELHEVYLLCTRDPVLHVILLIKTIECKINKDIEKSYIMEFTVEATVSVINRNHIKHEI